MQIIRFSSLPVQTIRFIAGANYPSLFIAGANYPSLFLVLAVKTHGFVRTCAHEPIHGPAPARSACGRGTRWGTPSSDVPA